MIEAYISCIILPSCVEFGVYLEIYFVNVKSGDLFSNAENSSLTSRVCFVRYTFHFLKKWTTIRWNLEVAK